MPSANTGPYGHGGSPGYPPSRRLAPPLRWRQIVAGEETSLSAVRAWVAALLPACPARDDVILVANELCANAVRHTASGRGGNLGAEITVWPPVVRVSVADAGSEQEPRVIERAAGEAGRGLLLVRELSAQVGVLGDQRGRLVWADIPWDGHPWGRPARPGR
jgi:anti-sigma regulatory factor (Ser/Thr protein kinase)